MNRYIEWQKHPPTHEPSPAEAFFTQTVPDFFTVDIPQGFAQFDQALAPLGKFTTIDVPHFFTETVPEGLEEAGAKIRDAGNRILWIMIGILIGYIILKEGIHAIFS